MEVEIITRKDGTQVIHDMDWIHYDILGQYLDEDHFLVEWICPICGVKQSGLPGYSHCSGTLGCNTSFWIIPQQQMTPDIEQVEKTA